MNESGEQRFWHFSVLDAANQIPGGSHMPMATVLQRGDARVAIYAPRKEDRQQPHVQDELYFVIRGTGHFSAGDQRCAFHPGDILFVPAGVEHRFHRFTDDVLLWVVYQGPSRDRAASSDQAFVDRR